MLIDYSDLVNLSEGGAVKLTTICTAFTIIFMSIEYLYMIKKLRFGVNTFFSWEISSTRGGWLFTGWRASFFSFVFEDSRFRLMIFLRMALSILMIINIENHLLVSFCLFVLFFISCLINIRHTHGRDGADEFTFIILLGLAVYYAIDNGAILRWAGPGFIIAQLTLSYFISGIYKLKSDTWRDGSALIKVVATVIYGKPGMLYMFKNKTVPLLGCWAIMIWECTFPLLFFVPQPICFIWLGLGVIFHITMAYVMGLNTFMFSFLSAYPLVFLLLSKTHF